MKEVEQLLMQKDLGTHPLRNQAFKSQETDSEQKEEIHQISFKDFKQKRKPKILAQDSEFKISQIKQTKYSLENMNLNYINISPQVYHLKLSESKHPS